VVSNLTVLSSMTAPVSASRATTWPPGPKLNAPAVSRTPVSSSRTTYHSSLEERTVLFQTVDVVVVPLVTFSRPISWSLAGLPVWNS